MKGPGQGRWSRGLILGAGRPARGVEPASLQRAGPLGPVLDWQRAALSPVCERLAFVGGYRVDDVSRRHPDLPVVLNPDWARTGPAGSLLRGLSGTAPASCLVCYADVLVRAELVERMTLAAAGPDVDLVLAVDAGWRARYDARAGHDLSGAEVVLWDAAGTVRACAFGRTVDPSRDGARHGELAGLVGLSPRAVARLTGDGLPAQAVTWSLPVLLQWLLDQGCRAVRVDATAAWAELNAPQDVARFVLGTKAETLDRLRPLVRRSEIGAQVRFTVAQWHADPAGTLRGITATLADGPLIVRSSALAEDGFRQSNAGRFLSIGGVDATRAAELATAVQRVIDSYGKADPDDQVLVQHLVPDIVLAGVAMTRTLSHGAPYLVLNYEQGSGRGDLVTSGGPGLQPVVICHHARDRLPTDLPAGLQAVREALVEVQALVAHDALDVEFLTDGRGVVHLVQVRPIAVDHAGWRGSDGQVEAMLQRAELDLARLQVPSPGLVGGPPLYSRMTDWNPAEMIGSRPRALARSLYEAVITREVWARQRAAYGYRDPGPTPLMHQFCGQAYIDVRASLNSFVPAAVDDALATRLVNHGLQQLRADPALHDKVEFAVACTCFDLGFDARARELAAAGFAPADLAGLRHALITLTVTAIDRATGDLDALRSHVPAWRRLAGSDLEPLRRARLQIDTVRTAGTPLFAHLARAAFIATALLRTSVQAGVIRADAQQAWLAGVPTVAGQLVDDLRALRQGRLSRERFLADYGHLRPGTYDLTVPSYAGAPDFYLQEGADGMGEVPLPAVDVGHVPAAMARALSEAGLPVDAARLDRFLRAAITGRELAKFEFTRLLSAALDALAAWGDTVGLDRETLSHLDWSELCAVADGQLGPDPLAVLRERAEAAAQRHELALGIELPDVIRSADDLRCFARAPGRPNFVGTGRVLAPLVVLDDGMELSDPGRLRGAIAVLRQADPGHDWLFGQGIAGLVTAYGGANSHMAVRAAEFGLPAAIGVGEMTHAGLCRHARALLDAGAQTLQGWP